MLNLAPETKRHLRDPALNARAAYVVSGVLFVVATGMTWQWLQQRQPTEITFDPAAVAKIPEYVTLKGVWLAHSDVATGSRWTTEKTYVAARSVQSPEVSSTSLVIEIADPVFIAAINVLSAEEDSKLTAKTVKALATLAAKHQVTGVINSSALTSGNRVKLRGALPSLSPGFVVLVEGEKPSLGPAILGYVAAMVVFLATYGLRFGRGRSGEPPVIAAALPSHSHPVSAPPLPPLLANAPTVAFRREILRELEAVDSGPTDDVVTAGIGMIKLGARELLPGWLRTFGQAEVFVVSIEDQNPQTAFVFGPEGERNYVAVFTRLDLAQACMREMPQLKFAMSLKGMDLMELARNGRRGIWVNPLNDACSVKFPAEDMARLIKAAAGTS